MDSEKKIDLDDRDLKRMLVLIHIRTGISMKENKKSLIQGRLRARMKELAMHSYQDYMERVENSQEEAQRFIDLVTTNETTFFRTQRVWDYFSSQFLPDWYANNQGKVLKIWSAASSSGEESYSIAMSCEEFRTKHKDFNYSIVGSDISANMVKRAEKGVYQGRNADGLEKSFPEYFKRYTVPTNDGITMVDHVRSKCRFFLNNLFVPKKIDQFDVVFLRNVLIYFESADQEIVLKNISVNLKKGGKLIIGESESLTGLTSDLTFIQPLVYEA